MLEDDRVSRRRTGRPRAGPIELITPRVIPMSSAPGPHAAPEGRKERVLAEVRAHFRPEFLNRLDEALEASEGDEVEVDATPEGLAFQVAERVRA
jgi:hypothetical protein